MQNKLTFRFSTNGRRILTTLAFLMLSAAMVYSFLGSQWIYSRNMATRAGDTSNLIYTLLTWGALLIVCFLAILGLKKISPSRFFFLFSLTTAVFIWSAITLMVDGSWTFLKNPTSPVVYLLVLGFFLGEKEEIWATVENLLMPLILFFSACLIVSFVSVFRKYGVVIIGHSDIIYYYVTLFWLIAVKCAERLITGKRLNRCHYVFLFEMIFFAFIIGSRSWILQSGIIFASFYLLNPGGKSYKSKLKRMVLFVLSLVLIGILIYFLLPNYLSQLFAKLFNDSRSHQYDSIFQTVKPLQWIFGKGAMATYYDSHQKAFIGSIDNQYLFIAFHYGLILMIPYMIIYFATLRDAFVGRTKMLPAGIVVLLWILALGGLSIFNVVYLDTKSLLLPVFCGHINATKRKRQGTST